MPCNTRRSARPRRQNGSRILPRGCTGRGHWEIPAAIDVRARCLARIPLAEDSATRASMSSISMAFAPCVNTRSAARSFVDAGVCWSNMILSTDETAAPDACCNRAVPCPNKRAR